MKIEILGVGGGLTSELGNTSFLIWNDDESEAVLMDCGSMVYAKLKELEQTSGRQIVSKITSVGISHLHNDHAGSLGTFLCQRWFSNNEKTKITGVETLEGYMKLIEPARTRLAIAGADDRIKTFPTFHEEDLPSCALYFDGVLYSGDTNQSVLTLPEAQEAKIIIHEARLNDMPSHMNIDKLAASAPSEILAKTWLVHYAAKMQERLILRAAELGFAGVCTPGQILKV